MVLRIDEKSVAASSVHAMQMAIAAVVDPESTEKTSRMKVAESRPPSANTSPCAKLISCRIP